MRDERDELFEAIANILDYREHSFGCEINQTDFCTCGLREAKEKLHRVWVKFNTEWDRLKEKDNH